LSERALHLRDEGALAEVECGMAGCYLTFQRRQLAEHEAGCEYRVVACERCQDRFVAQESDQHLLSCKGVEVECPQECGKMVLRGDLAEHEQECGEAVVCCSFADYGCQMRGKRRKISEHEEQATFIHLQLAASTAKRQREESSRLEMALAEKTKEVLERGEEVIALQGELKGCQTQLTENEKRAGALQAQMQVSQRETEKQVAELKAELRQKSELLLAQAQAGPSGEAKVVWKVENFTEKLKAKETVFSRTFHVDTKAGQYPMRLRLKFRRNPGCKKRGYAGLAVVHRKDEGGCLHFPFKISGTRVEVEHVDGPGGTNYKIQFGEGASIENPGTGRGQDSAFITDKIVGVTWSENDRQSNNRFGLKKDVTQYLDGDTMTVRATVRVTPPEELVV